MALKVIGAGLGRTGTLSLRVALEELGFARCYHMQEVLLAHPEHAPLWSTAQRREPVDWDSLFVGYQAAVDWPASAFYQELLRHYPDAKVILTVRDSERWYESARQTIYYARRVFFSWAIVFVPRIRRFIRMVDDVVWVGFFQRRFADKDHALAAFHRHNEEVRRTVPPDRLLVYEVGQGWGPLCEFLGVPVPLDKPFPRLNDTAWFRSQIGKVAALILGTGCAAVLLAVLGLVWLVSFLR
jgi:Sulfotransferase domain